MGVCEQELGFRGKIQVSSMAITHWILSSDSGHHDARNYKSGMLVWQGNMIRLTPDAP